MTARDALAEQERNARAALVSKLEQLVAEAESALFDAQVGRDVSVRVLGYRVDAVADCREILRATCQAQAIAVFQRARLGAA